MRRESEFNFYPSEGTSKRISLGTIANILSQAIRLLEQFFLIPLFLWTWGKVTYGEWLTIYSLVAYFSLSDIGTVSFISNKLTQYYSRGDTENYAKVFRSALSLYVAVTIILILPLIVFSFFLPFPDWFQISAASAQAARISVFLFGLYFLTMAIFALLNNLYVSVGEYARYQNLSNVRSILVIVVIGLVLTLGGGFIGVASVYLIFILVFTLFIIFDVRRRYPAVFKSDVKTDWRLARGFIVPGLVFLAIPLANMIKIQGSILVVGSALGAVSVAIFGIHRTLSNLTQQLTTIIRPVIQPEIAAYEERGNLGKVRLLHNFFLKMIFFLSISLALLLFFAGNDILKIWIRGDISFNPYLLLALIALALVDTFVLFSSTFQISVNKYFQFSWVTLTSSTLGLFLSFFLVKPFGLVGVVFGFLVAEIFMDFWIVPRKTLLIIKESKKDFLIIIAKGLFVTAIQGILAIFIHWYLTPSWLRVFVTIIEIFAIGGFFTYFVWLTDRERNIALSFLKRFQVIIYRLKK